MLPTSTLDFSRWIEAGDFFSNADFRTAIPSIVVLKVPIPVKYAPGRVLDHCQGPKKPGPQELPLAVSPLAIKVIQECLHYRKLNIPMPKYRLDSMTSTPELTNAGGDTSAEYLAERLKNAYQSLGNDNLDVVQTLYSTDVYFEDPSHAIQGRPALFGYFSRMFANLKDCQFKFHKTITNDTDIFMSWTMFLNHPRLNKGRMIRVEGASYLRTRNGKIYYHRDYFDMGAMVYENLPLLGRVVQTIKQRLGQ